MSSLGLMGIQLTPLIYIIKPWSSCKRRPFGALNSHLINQLSIKMYEHFLTLGILAALEMLNVAFSSVCKLGQAASASIHFRCHAQPLGV